MALENLVVIDFETTGTDPKKDRIVELCMKKDDVVKTYKVNPGIPIPASATECHGITDEMVADAPTFAQLAKGIHEFINGCDIAGFNSNRFDTLLLFCEFLRAGIEWDHSKVNFIDAHVVYVRQERRDLSAAVAFYLNREHDGAHGAEADVTATWEILQEQLIRYEDVPKDAAGLNLYCNYDEPRMDLSGCFITDDKGDIRFNFGKNKGNLATSDKRYLEWMMKDDNEFLPDTKKIVRHLLYKIG